MIYSHGYTDNANYNSGLARELASHGIIVFTLDHHDRSCPYTRKKDGTEITIDCTDKFGSASMVDHMVETRVDDIQRYADDILQPGFLKEYLDFPETVQLNQDNLVLAGHSFGAVTALRTCSKDERFKCCFTYDPYLKPRKDEHESYQF